MRMGTSFLALLEPAIDTRINEKLFRTPPGRNLKTLRVTSWQLMEVVTPCIFNGLYLSSHPRDLEIFHLICSTKTLPQHVTDFI